MFHVYVIYSDKAGLKYTGQTSNIEERLEQHNPGSLSKFTKNKGPWRLILLESFESRSEAVLREKCLKTGAGRLY